MPQVNLSALNGSELRQLLDASRRRGDAAASYSILQEMAARRDGSVDRSRRGSESRLLAVDLAEPAEQDDLPPMPNWRPPSPAAQDRAPEVAVASVSVVEPEAQEPVEMSRPLSLEFDDPGPPRDAVEDLDLRLGLASPKTRARPRGVSLRVFAGFTIGIALGTAFGWWAGGVARDVLPLPGPVQTAALTPARAPPPPVVPIVVEAPAEPAATPPPETSAQPEAQEPVHQAFSEASEPPAPTPSVVVKGCAREPTPADRVICGAPNLQRLQTELRQAYAEALDAHEDRDLLRQRQLAWRDARNTIADPDRLTALYEARIRKLNAATEEARQAR